MGWTGRLNSLKRTFLTNKTRKLDPRYAAAEFLWYFTEGGLEMISHYAPQYKNFAEVDGTINGAYGPRMRPQLSYLLELLQHSPNTRRAVIALWTARDLDIADYSRDVPCTLNFQFIIDDDKKLNMIATMRSNDVWLGFPYDVFVNTGVQRLIAGVLGLSTGWYQHQVGSMHVYEKNVEDAIKAYDEGSIGGVCFKDTDSRLCDVDLAINLERIYRKELTLGNVNFVRGFVEDILNCCINPSQIESEVLKNAYIRRHGLSW
jgi:hypothetical protein